MRRFTRVKVLLILIIALIFSNISGLYAQNYEYQWSNGLDVPEELLIPDPETYTGISYPIDEKEAEKVRERNEIEYLRLKARNLKDELWLQLLLLGGEYSTDEERMLALFVIEYLFADRLPDRDLKNKVIDKLYNDAKNGGSGSYYSAFILGKIGSYFLSNSKLAYKVEGYVRDLALGDYSNGAKIGAAKGWAYLETPSVSLEKAVNDFTKIYDGFRAEDYFYNTKNRLTAMALFEGLATRCIMMEDAYSKETILNYIRYSGISDHYPRVKGYPWTMSVQAILTAGKYGISDGEANRYSEKETNKLLEKLARWGEEHPVLGVKAVPLSIRREAWKLLPKKGYQDRIAYPEKGTGEIIAENVLWFVESTRDACAIVLFWELATPCIMGALFNAEVGFASSFTAAEIGRYIALKSGNILTYEMSLNAARAELPIINKAIRYLRKLKAKFSGSPKISKTFKTVDEVLYTAELGKDATSELAKSGTSHSTVNIGGTPLITNPTVVNEGIAVGVTKPSWNLTGFLANTADDLGGVSQQFMDDIGSSIGVASLKNPPVVQSPAGGVVSVTIEPTMVTKHGGLTTAVEILNSTAVNPALGSSLNAAATTVASTETGLGYVGTPEQFEEERRQIQEKRKEEQDDRLKKLLNSNRSSKEVDGEWYVSVEDIFGNVRWVNVKTAEVYVYIDGKMISITEIILAQKEVKGNLFPESGIVEAIKKAKAAVKKFLDSKNIKYKQINDFRQSRLEAYIVKKLEFDSLTEWFKDFVGLFQIIKGGDLGTGKAHPLELALKHPLILTLIDELKKHDYILVVDSSVIVSAIDGFCWEKFTMVAFDPTWTWSQLLHEFSHFEWYLAFAELEELIESANTKVYGVRTPFTEEEILTSFDFGNLVLEQQMLLELIKKHPILKEASEIMIETGLDLRRAIAEIIATRCSQEALEKGGCRLEPEYYYPRIYALKHVIREISKIFETELSSLSSERCEKLLKTHREAIEELNEIRNHILPLLPQDELDDDDW